MSLWRCWMNGCWLTCSYWHHCCCCVVVIVDWVALLPLLNINSSSIYPWPNAAASSAMEHISLSVYLSVCLSAWFWILSCPSGEETVEMVCNNGEKGGRWSKFLSVLFSHTNQIVSLLGKLARGFWLVQGLLTCAVCRFSCLKSEQFSWSCRKNTSRSEPLQISIFSPELCWHPQPDVVSDVSYMLSSTPWNTKNAKLNFFFCLLLLQPLNAYT